MSITAAKPATTPIPVQLSETEFTAFILPHLSMAKWADDGSVWQAVLASVRHLATEKQLDISELQGDGTNTVAKKGGMRLGTRGTNTRRARRSLPSSTIMALC